MSQKEHFAPHSGASDVCSYRAEHDDEAFEVSLALALPLPQLR